MTEQAAAYQANSTSQTVYERQEQRINDALWLARHCREHGNEALCNFWQADVDALEHNLRNMDVIEAGRVVGESDCTR